jgi:hypothetical protein
MIRRLWWRARCRWTDYHHWNGDGIARRCTVCGIGVYGQPGANG